MIITYLAMSWSVLFISVQTLRQVDWDEQDVFMMVIVPMLIAFIIDTAWLIIKFFGL